MCGSRSAESTTTVERVTTGGTSATACGDVPGTRPTPHRARSLWTVRPHQRERLGPNGDGGVRTRDPAPSPPTPTSPLPLRADAEGSTPYETWGWQQRGGGGRVCGGGRAPGATNDTPVTRVREAYSRRSPYAARARVSRRHLRSPEKKIKKTTYNDDASAGRGFLLHVCLPLLPYTCCFRFGLNAFEKEIWKITKKKKKENGILF